MWRSRNSSLAIVVLCAVVVPALAGLIIGGISAPEPPPPRGEVLGGQSVAMFVPPSWRRVERAEKIPGLPMKGGIALAPGGNAQDIGLVAGQVKTGGKSPLPPSLLRRLRGDLRTEVVGVGTWDGYRYDDVRLEGFRPRLVLYAVPTASGAAAVACYARKAGVARLPACERIARSLEILSGPEADLPEVSQTYGRSVSRAIQRLDRRRLAQRAKLRRDAEPDVAERRTFTISSAYETTASSLADVSPPEAAAGAHAALVRRLWRARDAYRRLGRAAGQEDQGDWKDARKAVRRAEARVSAALGDLGALGYGRSA
jgi:hypothetical protein